MLKDETNRKIEKKRRRVPRRHIRFRFQYLICGILAAILAVSGFFLVKDLFYLAGAKSVYNDLKKQYKTGGDASGSEDANAEYEADLDDIVPETIKAISIDTDGLKSKNPDYVAWMVWKDAGVDLPVCYDTNADGFYLHHLFSGDYDYAGTLLLDHESNTDFSSPTSFIFGHNMKNNSMFGYINDIYRDPAGKMTDKHFYLNVDGHWKGYAIFAMESIPATSDLFRIPGDDEDYDAYVQEAIDNAVVNLVDDSDTDINRLIERRCPIVVLSTCDGGEGAVNRLVTFGIETKAEN